MNIFNRLAGYTRLDLKRRKDTPPMVLAREKYGRPSVKNLVETLSLPNTIGFLIARHPYERLVSAYRDKILEPKRHTIYDVISKHIIVRYRSQDKLPWDFKGFPPTFTEFIQYILEQEDAGYEPDMHWAPVYSFCNPCQVHLTHIIRMETFDRDTKEILKKANLTQYLPSVQKRRLNISSGERSSYEAAQPNLDQLPRELRKRLYNMYKIDMDLFGYEEEIS